jgi:hypothetical protein
MQRFVLIACYAVGLSTTGLLGLNLYLFFGTTTSFSWTAVVAMACMKVAVAMEVVRHRQFTQQSVRSCVACGLLGGLLDVLLSVGGVALIRLLPEIAVFQHIVFVFVVYGIVVVLIPTSFALALALAGIVGIRANPSADEVRGQSH